MKKLHALLLAFGLVGFVGCGGEAETKKTTTPAPSTVKKEESKMEPKKEESKMEPKKEESKMEPKKEESKMEPKKEEKAPEVKK